LRYKEYFDKLAPKRVRDRRRHAYYWNDITHYCNYFSHEYNSVLEIGCGTGETIHDLKGKRKVGIAYSEKMIEIAKQQFSDVEFHVMAAENIQLEEKFDLIILSNLVGFLDDVQLVFKQLQKVCHPGTKIIITYYNFLWEPLVKFAELIGIKRATPNQNWLLKHDIKNLLALSGFEVYRKTNTTMFPFYIPLLSSFLNRFLVRLPLFRLLALNSFTFAKPVAEKYDSSTDSLSVSIVIPARNEAGTIESAIRRIPKFGKSQELIFVEGNSTDNT